MSKIHFVPFSYYGDQYSWAICRLSIIKKNTTNNPEKVTCKNCLRAMAAREKDRDG